MNGPRPLVVSAVPINAIPLRKAEGLKPAEAAHLLYRAMRPLDMPGVVAAGLKKETIFWRILLNGWTTVRWVTVTQYARELLRLRNDLPPFIPTKVWPFALPEYRQFKLTFHWSEFNTSLGEPVYAFCAAMADKATVHGWQLFDGEQGYPGYGWTRLAHKWYAENKSQG